MPKKTYSISEVCELTKFHASYLNKIRNTQKEIPAVLKENVHWEWSNGEVIYFPAAITVLKNLPRRKRK